nr:hypothetical protein 32 [Balneolaceae bacterium]
MTDYSKPENRFMGWGTDEHPLDLDLEANVNVAVADAINRLELFACTTPGMLILRLENDCDTGTGDPFIRPITFDTIRDALAVLEWDNAEEHAELLAKAFEDLAAKLREHKGTFGDGR